MLTPPNVVVYQLTVALRGISPTTVIAVLKKSPHFNTPSSRWYRGLVRAAPPSASN
jgi:hypothetical protein